MGHSGATLLVGSCEPFSGKSALVMGLVQQLRDKGQTLRYGKPLATSIEQHTQGDALIDDDVLDAFAVGAEPDNVAGELKRRFSSVVDRLSFYAPYEAAGELVPAMLAELRAD